MSPADRPADDFLPPSFRPVADDEEGHPRPPLNPDGRSAEEGARRARKRMAAREERRDRRPRAVGWRSRDVIRSAALVVALWAGLQLLWRAYPLLLATFLGILFGLAVTSAVDRLERLRVPRFAGAALVVFGALGLIGGLFALSAPLLAKQSQELRVRLPQAIDKIDAWIARQQGGVIGSLMTEGAAPPDGGGGAATGEQATGRDAGASRAAPPDAGRRSPVAAPGDGPSSARGAEGTRRAQGAPPAGERITVRGILSSGFGNTRKMLFPFITSAAAAIAGVLYVIFLAVYTAAEPDLYQNGMMHLVPQRSRRKAADVLTAVAAQLRRWLTTQLIAMIVIAVVSTGVLLALGVPGAVPLGLLAGLLEFIPTFGPILSAIPAILMGFVDSPQKALSVALAYMVIQFLEENILIPMLMKRGVDLPPALTIMAQALMALVFGFLGLLVAVPLLAAIVVGVKLLYVEGVVKDPMPDARRLVKSDATG